MINFPIFYKEAQQQTQQNYKDNFIMKSLQSTEDGLSFFLRDIQRPHPIQNLVARIFHLVIMVMRVNVAILRSCL